MLPWNKSDFVHPSNNEVLWKTTKMTMCSPIYLWMKVKAPVWLAFSNFKFLFLRTLFGLWKDLSGERRIIGKQDNKFSLLRLSSSFPYINTTLHILDPNTASGVRLLRKLKARMSDCGSWAVVDGMGRHHSLFPNFEVCVVCQILYFKLSSTDCNALNF